MSHQLDIVKCFCHQGILLDHGRVVLAGNVRTVLDAYTNRFLAAGGVDDLSSKVRRGHGRARFAAVRFLNEEGQPVNEITSGSDLRCLLEVDSSYTCRDLSLAVVFKTMQGARILTSWTEEVGFKPTLVPGKQVFECRFQQVRLRPGQKMLIDLWMYDGDEVDSITEACVLDVVEATPLGYSTRADQGPMLCDYSWSHSA